MHQNIAIRAIRRLAYKKNLELLGDDMKLPTLSNTVKGILFIITGTILLLNILGITTELMHSIILFGSIGMIILGFFMADFHKRIMSLVRKKEAPHTPQDHTDDSSTDDRNNHQQF